MFNAIEKMHYISIANKVNIFKYKKLFISTTTTIILNISRKYFIDINKDMSIVQKGIIFKKNSRKLDIL